MGPRRTTSFCYTHKHLGLMPKKIREGGIVKAFLRLIFFKSQVSYLQPSAELKPIRWFRLRFGYDSAPQTGNDIFTSKWGLRNGTVQSNFQEVITIAVGDTTGIVSAIWRKLLICLESAEFSWK